jgi:hypothetical protein
MAASIGSRSASASGIETMIPSGSAAMAVSMSCAMATTSRSSDCGAR